MKGIVFDLLRDMVEENYGLESWQKILEVANSDGIFVATLTYQDADLMALIAATSSITEIAADDLVFSFGEYMIPNFYRRFPAFFEEADNFLEFLVSVDQIIHVEVKKLYPEANLPSFKYHDQQPDSLTMVYSSPRKLCQLAEGLISGSAKHFNQTYKINHDICIHTGSEHCVLKINLVAKP